MTISIKIQAVFEEKNTENDMIRVHWRSWNVAKLDEHILPLYKKHVHGGGDCFCLMLEASFCHPLSIKLLWLHLEKFCSHLELCVLTRFVIFSFKDLSRIWNIVSFGWLTQDTIFSFGPDYYQGGTRPIFWDETEKIDQKKFNPRPRKSGCWFF